MCHVWPSDLRNKDCINVIPYNTIQPSHHHRQCVALPNKESTQRINTPDPRVLTVQRTLSVVDPRWDKPGQGGAAMGRADIWHVRRSPLGVSNTWAKQTANGYINQQPRRYSSLLIIIIASIPRDHQSHLSLLIHIHKALQATNYLKWWTEKLLLPWQCWELLLEPVPPWEMLVRRQTYIGTNEEALKV